MDNNSTKNNDNQHNLNLIKIISTISRNNRKTNNGSYNGCYMDYINNKIINDKINEIGVLYHETLPHNFIKELSNAKISIGDDKFINLINGNRCGYDKPNGIPNIIINDLQEIKFATFGGSIIRRLRQPNIITEDQLQTIISNPNLKQNKNVDKNTLINLRGKLNNNIYITKEILIKQDTFFIEFRNKGICIKCEIMTDDDKIYETTEFKLYGRKKGNPPLQNVGNRGYKYDHKTRGLIPIINLWNFAGQYNCNQIYDGYLTFYIDTNIYKRRVIDIKYGNNNWCISINDDKIIKNSNDNYQNINNNHNHNNNANNNINTKITNLQTYFPMINNSQVLSYNNNKLPQINHIMINNQNNTNIQQQLLYINNNQKYSRLPPLPLSLQMPPIPSTPISLQKTQLSSLMNILNKINQNNNDLSQQTISNSLNTINYNNKNSTIINNHNHIGKENNIINNIQKQQISKPSHSLLSSTNSYNTKQNNNRYYNENNNNNHHTNQKTYNNNNNSFITKNQLKQKQYLQNNHNLSTIKDETEYIKIENVPTLGKDYDNNLLIMNQLEQKKLEIQNLKNECNEWKLKYKNLWEQNKLLMMKIYSNPQNEKRQKLNDENIKIIHSNKQSE